MDEIVGRAKENFLQQWQKVKVAQQGLEGMDIGRHLRMQEKGRDKE